MRWIVDENRFEDDNIHCSECGAMIEKESWTKHMFIYCYHCGKECKSPLSYRHIAPMLPKEDDNE